MRYVEMNIFEFSGRHSILRFLFVYMNTHAFCIIVVVTPPLRPLQKGGVTKYTGGIRLIVIPAGYVGCAFWGGFFVALSGSRIGATVVASLITFALLLSLW